MNRLVLLLCVCALFAACYAQWGMMGGYPGMGMGYGGMGGMGKFDITMSNVSVNYWALLEDTGPINVCA